MLIDPTFTLDPVMSQIYSVLSGGKSHERVQRGCYLDHSFNFGMQLAHRQHTSEGWCVFSHDDPSYDLHARFGLDEYGVCDSVGQFMEAFGDKLDAANDREFVIAFTRVAKSEQPPSGGWRWHKWGSYIGKHEPQYEYLYGEPEIEEVYVFHVYHRAPPRGPR